MPILRYHFSKTHHIRDRLNAQAPGVHTVESSLGLSVLRFLKVVDIPAIHHEVAENVCRRSWKR